MIEKLSIKVNIADRFYPLKIEGKDEEKIRKAAKLINDKVLQYKQKYVDKDVQDFLAMAALQFVIKMLDFENDGNIDTFIEDLNELDQELESVIKRE